MTGRPSQTQPQTATLPFWHKNQPPDHPQINQLDYKIFISNNLYKTPKDMAQLLLIIPRLNHEYVYIPHGDKNK
jgi:hypothetical protein